MIHGQIHPNSMTHPCHAQDGSVSSVKQDGSVCSVKQDGSVCPVKQDGSVCPMKQDEPWHDDLICMQKPDQVANTANCSLRQ